ncbi:hypothetical protein E4T39_02506 [Aureobasidium subglaciale]|nr:hypothetical protein E4T39_02506 [Aureobasidium subglaciale]
MSQFLSTDWEARLSTLDALYRPGTHNQCIVEAHALLQEPLLPRLHGIKCHMMLARCSASTLQRTRHMNTAGSLWSTYNTYWSSSEPTTEMLGIRKQLDELVSDLSGSQFSWPMRLSGGKRPRSSTPESPSPKRFKWEPYESSVTNDHGHDNTWIHRHKTSYDGWGDKIYPGRNSDFGDPGHTASQDVHSYTEDSDVKYGPADPDAEYEGRQIESMFESDECLNYQAPKITLPQVSQLLNQSPASLPLLLLSPQLSSPSSHFKRGPTPSCVIPLPKEPSLFSAMPQAPRLEPLTSPLGPRPTSLFSEEPPSSPLVDGQRMRYSRMSMRNLEETLGGDLITDGMIPSPADDVFGPTTQERPPQTNIEVVMHNRNIASCVADPASGLVSKYAVVLRDEEHGEMTGYPCSDFAFRTGRGEILGYWNRMGSIIDISGEPIRQYFQLSGTLY